MTIEYKAMLFVLATFSIFWISRSSLSDVRFHGFYRFFAWETILILFLMNMNYWFVVPLSLRQIVSWSFLIVSLVLIYLGVQSFRKRGKIDPGRSDTRLVGIEKTTELITTGIYHYIRHPFYSSLFFLGWGIFLKNLSWAGIVLAIINTLLLIATARREEIENIEYFGEKYQEFIQRTKMFVPFIF